MEIVKNIVESLQVNALLTTAIGLSMAGLVTFWVKDFPKKIGAFLYRHVTTTLTVTSYNQVFFEILCWIEQNHKNKNFRKIKINNGRYGDGGAIVSAGYGNHLIIFQNTIFSFNLSKETNNQGYADREYISITKLGRSRKKIDQFIKEVQSAFKDDTRLNLYEMKTKWEYVNRPKKRTLDTVFIEQNKKDLLVQTLDNFIKNEDYYLAHGIPYQLGILLHGKPGTGKTSLLKAIATYLNYDIFYLSAANLYYIEQAMSTLPEKCVIIIEDIDGNSVTHQRKSKKLAEPQTQTSEKRFSWANLSDVLNSLDGLFSVHGRILLMTTNHLENLDEALIRPGRVDLKLEIGFVNNETFQFFIDKFFPDNNINCSKLVIKDGVSMAQLQNFALQNKPIDDIIELVKEV